MVQSPVSTLDRRNAANGLAVLSELAQRRQERHGRFRELRLPDDFDETPDSPSPIYDLFYETSGVNGIHNMTNLSPAEFDMFWRCIARQVTVEWSRHRGQRSSFFPKDVCFMTLCVLKNAGKWSTLAAVFRVKAPTFQKTITKFIKILSPIVYETYVEGVDDEHPIDRLTHAGTGFRYYPCARYATDVTFQQTNMPGKTLADRQVYYSAKHHLHGYKVEVSVLPTGLAIGCTNHYPGIEADITIFRKNKDFHEAKLRKTPGLQERMPDEGPLAAEYPESWAVLCDKGYQGLIGEVRAIHPSRTPSNRLITPTEEQRNRDISSDRIVVENFFGRLCTLWAICSDKYRWDEDLYDPIFRACVALTNLHAGIHPLRAESDGNRYQLYQQRLYGISREMRERTRGAQQRYREMDRIRLDLAIQSAHTADSGLT